MSAVPSPSITVKADLSSNWAFVRDQGRRPTCLAMSASDVHMVAHAKQEAFASEALVTYGLKYLAGGPLRDGLTFPAVAQALSNDGQPLEVAWPYGPLTASACSAGSHHHWFGELEVRAGASTIDITKEIERGNPVILGLRLTDDFFRVKAPWIIRDTVLGYALHAVVGAGTATDEKGEPLIFIRNSWGDRWGVAGYAWIHEGYLARNLVDWCVVRKK